MWGQPKIMSGEDSLTELTERVARIEQNREHQQEILERIEGKLDTNIDRMATERELSHVNAKMERIKSTQTNLEEEIDTLQSENTATESRRKQKMWYVSMVVGGGTLGTVLTWVVV